jgi:multidrug transporter EmrE-like cation transporter
MTSEEIRFYFLLIFAIVFFECIAQYHIKKSKINNTSLYILIAIFSYSIVCLLLKKCYDFHGVGMTNFVWSIVSIVTMLIVGAVMFNETVTKYDAIGIVLSVIGLYLIFIYGH